MKENIERDITDGHASEYPSIDDLLGLAPWWTNGLSVDEHMRKIRGGADE